MIIIYNMIKEYFKDAIGLVLKCIMKLCAHWCCSIAIDRIGTAFAVQKLQDSTVQPLTLK